MTLKALLFYFPYIKKFYYLQLLKILLILHLKLHYFQSIKYINNM